LSQVPITFGSFFGDAGRHGSIYFFFHIPNILDLSQFMGRNADEEPITLSIRDRGNNVVALQIIETIHEHDNFYWWMPSGFVNRFTRHFNQGHPTLNLGTAGNPLDLRVLAPVNRIRRNARETLHRIMGAMGVPTVPADQMFRVQNREVTQVRQMHRAITNNNRIVGLNPQPHWYNLVTVIMGDGNKWNTLRRSGIYRGTDVYLVLDTRMNIVGMITRGLHLREGAYFAFTVGDIRFNLQYTNMMNEINRILYPTILHFRYANQNWGTREGTAVRHYPTDLLGYPPEILLVRNIVSRNERNELTMNRNIAIRLTGNNNLYIAYNQRNLLTPRFDNPLNIDDLILTRIRENGRFTQDYLDYIEIITVNYIRPDPAGSPQNPRAAFALVLELGQNQTMTVVGLIGANYMVDYDNGGARVHQLPLLQITLQLNCAYTIGYVNQQLRNNRFFVRRMSAFMARDTGGLLNLLHMAGITVNIGPGVGIINTLFQQHNPTGQLGFVNRARLILRQHLGTVPQCSAPRPSGT